MALKAAEVLDRARRVILDETSVRWPLPELALWLNDGLRELVIRKPSATAAPVVLPLVEGTLQTIPAEYVGLLRVVRNMELDEAEPPAPTVPGRAIRLCPRDQLDTLVPDWHTATPAGVVRHVIYDEAAPRNFYVYPPNDGEGLVEAMLSVLPEDVAATGAGDTIDDYDVEVPVHEVYRTVLTDYVLYRAYSKDAQFAGNAQRAAAYYGNFESAIGIKSQAETGATPNAARSVPTG